MDTITGYCLSTPKLVDKLLVVAGVTFGMAQPVCCHQSKKILERYPIRSSCPHLGTHPSYSSWPVLLSKVTPVIRMPIPVVI